MEGWTDGSSVGLGCIYGDVTDRDVTEVEADTICHEFSEAGRLVEIFSYDQVHWLRNLLANLEWENNLQGDIYWWIGLSDHAEEGTWVWPSGMAGNFTWWDEDYGEPAPDIGDFEYDCVQKLSSEWDSLKWMTYSCGDPRPPTQSASCHMPVNLVCQLP